MADSRGIRFNGVELTPRDRELITILLDHDQNVRERQTAVSANYIIENASTLNHRSQVSRSRSRLHDAGLLDIREVETPDPLANAKLMLISPTAFDHAEFLRWRPAESLEDRVDRLESLVANHIRTDADVDPDGFLFED